MFILGLILLLVGWITGLSILYTIGAILLVIGLILMLVGTAAPWGPHWW